MVTFGLNSKLSSALPIIKFNSTVRKVSRCYLSRHKVKKLINDTLPFERANLIGNIATNSAVNWVGGLEGRHLNVPPVLRVVFQ